MNTEELLQHAEQILQPWAKTKNRPAADRLDVEIEPGDLTAAVDALIFKPQLGYLAAITGLDHPAVEGQAEGSLEFLYTFCEQSAIVSLRVSLPYSNPILPTLCTIIPSATIYERELIEMFGVTIEGTPCTDRLLLPDDWPDGIYPLRKSFTGLV